MALVGQQATQAPQTPQQSALQQLAANMPVANARVAQQQKAARDLQLQAAVAAAPPAANTAANAQQTGAAQATAAGTQEVAAVQQQGQASSAIAALGQQAQQLQDQKKVTSLQQGADEQKFDGAQRLAEISQTAKKEMIDSRRAFETDRLGEKFSNERQLADYARLRATSDDQFKDYSLKTDQLNQRSGQLLQTASARITESMEQTNSEVEQLKEQLASAQLTREQKVAQQQILKEKLDQQYRLHQAEVQVRLAYQRKAAKAANTSAKNTAIGSVAGAVIGGAVGSVVPVVGTAGGAVVGSAVGGAIGSQVK